MIDRVTNQGGEALDEQLRTLGVSGVLVRMAERGQLLKLQCEMPKCYCHKGRGWFEPKAVPLRTGLLPLTTTRHLSPTAASWSRGTFDWLTCPATARTPAGG
jgi:hypothetical protein